MNKRYRHSFTLFVCLFVFFSLTLYTVQAKTYVTSGLEYKNWSCSQMSRAGYLTMDGHPVFCVEPHIIYKVNQQYETISTRPSYISESKEKKLSLISYYGTKYFQTERHYAASQSLIWIELGEPVAAATFKVDGVSVKPEMDEIMKLVDTHETKPSFSNQTFTIEVGKTIEIEDTHHVLERFTIEPINGIDIQKNGNTLFITASSSAPKQATINVNHEADSHQGTTIYYKIPGTSEGNGWQICGNFYVKEGIYSSFNLNIIHYESPILKTVQVTKEDKDQGTITILKTDSQTNQGLEDTLIEIQMDKNVLASNLKTDSDGKVSVPFEKMYQAQSDVITYITNFDKLSPEHQEQYKDTFQSYDEAHNYASNQAKERLEKLINDASYTFTAIEKQPRNGYYSTNNSTSITTKENNVELHLQNSPQTLEIELLKLDEINNTPIQDVIFGLYAKEDIIHPDGKTGLLFSKDMLVATFPKTNVEGKTKLTDLYLGQYYILEHTSPLSYATITTPIDLAYNVSNNPITSIQKTIYNQPTQIELIKIDAKTQQPLEGAHLQLMDSNHQIIDEWISSSESHLLYGLNRNEMYTLIESKAPEGYSLSNPITFMVKDTNKRQSIVLENQLKRVNLTIYKQDEFHQPLKDASFVLMNENKDIIETKVTDKQGEITFSNLSQGTYYIQEVQAPEGYILNEEIIEVQLNQDKQITLSNLLIPTKNTGDNQKIIPVLISCIASLSIAVYVQKKKGRSLL